MAESANQTGTIKLLRQRGAWVVKVHNTGRGVRGTPDVLACYKGRFIAVENKSDRGKATAQQLVQLREIQAAGGQALIVTSDRRTLAALLDHIDRLADVPEPLFSADALPQANVVLLDDHRVVA